MSETDRVTDSLAHKQTVCKNLFFKSLTPKASKSFKTLNLKISRIQYFLRVGKVKKNACIFPLKNKVKIFSKFKISIKIINIFTLKMHFILLIP